MRVGYALNRFEGLNNEPDMEAPWAYHYAGPTDSHHRGRPGGGSTSSSVPAAAGLAGNDDSGGLSSWYVWASLGLFPVAGQSLFLVNAPSFAHTTVDVGGSPLTIESPGFVEPERGGPCQYVHEVRLDGRPIDRSWLSATELHAANHLEISLGDRPSSWATSTRPPSAPTDAAA